MLLKKVLSYFKFSKVTYHSSADVVISRSSVPKGYSFHAENYDIHNKAIKQQNTDFYFSFL